jgi:hypothetical protein
MSNEHNIDNKIQDLVDNLPEHAPKRDLWPGIEHALVQRPKRLSNNRGLYAVAASICFLAVLGFLSVQQLPMQQDSGALALIAALETQHKQNKDALLVQYQNTATVTDTWHTQLSELESAAEMVKNALNEDPNNTALLKMLQYIHQQQIAVIEKSHAKANWQQI